MRPFPDAAIAQAKTEIATHVVEPAHEDGSRPVDAGSATRPYGGQRSGFTETAFVGLRRIVIVRMHDDRFGNVNNSVSLCPAPTRVFVVLGVLHLFQKPAPRPDVFTQAAADHAEEVVPVK